MARARDIARNVRNRRRKVRKEPPHPKSRQEIELPLECTVMQTGERFLLYDSGKTEERMLVFGTPTNLTLLSKQKVWFADGTFKTRPLLFYQVYTIHVFIAGQAVPAVYALLPNKKKKTYKELLQALLDLEPSLSPDTVITDFEQAAIKAFTSVFPHAEQHGCFFHFAQAIFRKIQFYGLQARYEIDSNFALQMRHLSALAFVPPDYVAEAFDQLVESELIPAAATCVLDYFEDTWLGRRTRDGRRKPLFPPTLWSCYNSVLTGSPRTDNGVEAWHRGFEALTSGNHENIYRTVNNFQKAQSLTNLAVEQFIAGHSPPRKKRKYINVDRRLWTIVVDFADRRDGDGLLTYLRGIAHNIAY